MVESIKTRNICLSSSENEFDFDISTAAESIYSRVVGLYLCTSLPKSVQMQHTHYCLLDAIIIHKYINWYLPSSASRKLCVKQFLFLALLTATAAALYPDRSNEFKSGQTFVHISSLKYIQPSSMIAARIAIPNKNSNLIFNLILARTSDREAEKQRKIQKL